MKVQSHVIYISSIKPNSYYWDTLYYFVQWFNPSILQTIVHYCVCITEFHTFARLLYGSTETWQVRVLVYITYLSNRFCFQCNISITNIPLFLTCNIFSFHGCLSEDFFAKYKILCWEKSAILLLMTTWNIMHTIVEIYCFIHCN